MSELFLKKKLVSAYFPSTDNSMATNQDTANRYNNSNNNEYENNDYSFVDPQYLGFKDNTVGGISFPNNREVLWDRTVIGNSNYMKADTTISSLFLNSNDIITIMKHFVTSNGSSSNSDGNSNTYETINKNDISLSQNTIDLTVCSIPTSSINTEEFRDYLNDRVFFDKPLHVFTTTTKSRSTNRSDRDTIRNNQSTQDCLTIPIYTREISDRNFYFEESSTT